jgi:lipoprotein-anchoring transpeptidase ErfK/SrfK
VLPRIGISLLVALALGGVVAPASRQYPAIAPGVRIGSTDVGGLTAEPARAAAAKALAEPLRVTADGKTWTVFPASLGARADIESAVMRALKAGPGGHVPVDVRVPATTVRDFVTKISRSVDRKPRDARLVGFAKKPLLAPERPGLAVSRDAAADAIRSALSTGGGTVALPTDELAPKRTRAHFGMLVVVERFANRLRLYDGRKLVRQFGVATGQSIYPTPSGSYKIVDKQLNPWWYPPPSPWAAGEKPVPPGPGNPLGTRWMGIDSPGVGIHGTPNDASIGYSASHGCIRMHIPDAEWLFQHVAVGTPVVIV